MNTKPSVKSLSQAVLLLFLIQSLSSQAAPTSTIQANDLEWVVPQEEHPSTDDNDTPSNENGDIVIMYPPPNFLERSTPVKPSFEEFQTIFQGLPVTIVDAETLRPKRDATNPPSRRAYGFRNWGGSSTHDAPQEKLPSTDNNYTTLNENDDIDITYPPSKSPERSTPSPVEPSLEKMLFFSYHAQPVTILDAEALRGKRDVISALLRTRHQFENWGSTRRTAQQHILWGGKRVVLPEPKEPTKNEETSQNEENEPMKFKSELERINYKLANKEFEKVMKQMPDECVEDVKSGRYDSAIQKLLILGDSEIDYIVKTLYNNKESNFDVVIKFAQNVPNNDKALLIYKALYNEVKPINEQTANGRLTKFIKINENLSKQLIFGERVTESVRTKARALFDILNETIEPTAMEMISDAFISARGLSHDTICRLKQDLRKVSFKYMKTILDKSMDYAWNAMSKADRRLNAERFMNELSTLYKEQSCN